VREDKVHLAEELRDRVRAYVDGRSSLADLRGWLADHVQDVADTRDPELNELDGQAWILISEHDYGHRDEASIKAALRRSLQAHPAARAVTRELDAR